MNGRQTFSPRAGLIIIGVIITVGCLGLSILLWYSDNTRQGEILITRLHTQINKLSALEWQAIARLTVKPDLLEKVAETRHEFSQSVTALDNLYLKFGRKAQLIAAWDTYNTWLDKELRFIATGNIEQAINIDEVYVDPAFENLERILRNIELDLFNQGEQVRLTSILGAIGLILGSGILIGLLIVRNHRAIVAMEALHTEQRILKQSEENLQIEKNKLGSVIGAMTSYLTIRDRDYTVTYQSPLAEEFFGNFTGKKCYQMFGLEEKICTSCPVELASHDARSHRAINEIVGPDGKITYFENIANPIKDSQGEITSFLVITTDITAFKRAEQQLLQTLENLRRAINTTIQVMVSAVETRDPYTAGHQVRSADLARAIATEMGFDKEKIEGIRMACSIHDIGKLSIPAEILSKPTKLSELEFLLIKEHAHKGFEMLKDVESPWPLAEIVYQHHERIDGSGYPSNLKGDEILMEARIISVADVVEAMSSHRPYRPSLGIDAALEEIAKNGGTLYDQTVADACLRLFREKGFQIART